MSVQISTSPAEYFTYKYNRNLPVGVFITYIGCFRMAQSTDVNVMVVALQTRPKITFFFISFTISQYASNKRSSTLGHTFPTTMYIL